MLTTNEALERLSFGGDVAEDDLDQPRHFLRTTAFELVVRDEKDVILGPKGSGKTAIFNALKDAGVPIAELANTDVIAAFNVQNSLLLRRLAPGGMELDEPFYRRAFFTYFVSLAANHILSNYPGSESLRTLLSAAGLLVDLPTDKAVLRSLIRALRPRFELSATLDALGHPTIAGSATLQEAQEDSLDELYEDIQAILMACNEALIANSRSCWIIFDRLDEAFTDMPAMEGPAIRGLLHAYLDLKSFRTLLKVKVFLRSDILERITRDTRFSGFSHLRVQRISWSTEEILSILAMRIEQSGVLEAFDGVDFAEATDKQICRAILPGRMGRRRDFDATLWLLATTQDSLGSLNPRNVLTLLNYARADAVLRTRDSTTPASRETGLIPAESLGLAHNETAKARLEDTVYAEYPELRHFVERLKGSSLEFTEDEVLGRFVDGPISAIDALRQVIAVGVLRRVDGGLLISPLYRTVLLDRGASMPSANETEVRPPSSSATVETGNLARPTVSESEPGSEDVHVVRPRRRGGYRDEIIGAKERDELLGESSSLGRLAADLGVEMPRLSDQELRKHSPALDAPPSIDELGSFDAPAARSLLVAGDPAAAIDMARSHIRTNLSAATISLDAAIEIGLEDRSELVQQFRDSPLKRFGAIQGRLLTIAVLDGVKSEVTRAATSISPQELDNAAAGILQLTRTDPGREALFYKLTRTYADDAREDLGFLREIKVLHASRVLALARGMGGDAGSSRQIGLTASRAYWAMYQTDVVRLLHGATYAWIQRRRARISFVPYQILSIAEVLREQGAMNRGLEIQVEEALVNSLTGDKLNSEKFSAWSAWSGLASRVSRKLQ